MSDRSSMREATSTFAGKTELASPANAPEPRHYALPQWLPLVLIALVAAVFSLALVIAVRPFWLDDDIIALREDVASLRERDNGLAEQVAVLEGEKATLQGQVAELLKVPVCDDAASYVTIISQHEAAAEWDAAFTTAQATLRLENLCETIRIDIAEKAVSDGLSAIWALPAPSVGDYAAQEQAVTRYETLRRLAETHSVTFPLTERQIAGEAFQGSRFLLAMLAMERGFESGQIDVGDLLQVGFYHDSMYNLGWSLTRQDSNSRFEHGLQLLATAAAIDNQYRLGRSSAAEELRRLLGVNSSRWPEPLTNPLLSVD